MYRYLKTYISIFSYNEILEFHIFKKHIRSYELFNQNWAFVQYRHKRVRVLALVAGL